MKLNSDGSNSGDTIKVDTPTVEGTGHAITQDAQDLQRYMTDEWAKYNIQNGSVPAMCLRNDFDTIYNQQKPLTAKAIENRIKIGETLEQSSTLWEFQEAVTAQGFDGPNIYKENNYYGPNDPTNPDSLKRPGGFDPLTP